VSKAPQTPVEPRAASSVILLRLASAGFELLYLLRNPELRFHGGYWVFPGGRIDATDYPDDRSDEERAAKQAAVREAREEAGVEVEVDSLEFAIHWTTPVTSPIRFSTWFFVAKPRSQDVTIDGGEIHDHRWLSPTAALREQRDGTMKLAAPTFALTSRLAEFSTADAALAAVSSWPEERLLGSIQNVPGGRLALYSQDAAYGNGILEASGPRHRLWMVDSGWRYERDF
jgi:8-oxo-dGTP pyrophosphatase MutT (NUDIX family)